MSVSKRKVLIISRYKRIVPQYLDDANTDFYFLLPYKNKIAGKYAQYYEDIDEGQYEKVFKVDVASGIVKIYKELAKIKAMQWDSVYIIVPTFEIPYQYIFLSIFFSPIVTFMIGNEYNKKRISILGNMFFLMKSLILSKNVRHRYPAILSRKLKWTYNLGKPSTAIIENTNCCDQKCPVCETGLGILNRAKGTMQLDEFKFIIDTMSKYLEKVSIYYMGEPLLDATIYDKIRYAVDKELFTFIATNGNFLDVDKLFASGLHKIDFKMSGMNAETHDQYRVGGSLENVIEHIKVIIEERKKRKRILPYIGLGFIVMKHNEHQIDEFIKFAQRLGVDNYRLIKTCLRDVDQAKRMLPTDDFFSSYKMDALEQGRLELKMRPENRCGVLWHQTVLAWNGDVFPCCTDVHGTYSLGNIFKQKKFLKIWNSKKMRHMRRTVVTDQRSLKICDLCQEFISTR